MVDFVSLSTIVPSLLSNYYASSSIAKPLSPPTTRSTWRLPADKALLEERGPFATLWDPDNDRPLPKPAGVDSPRSAAAAAAAAEEVQVSEEEAMSPLARPPPPELEAALAAVTVTSVEPLVVTPTAAVVAAAAEGSAASDGLGGTGGVVMQPRPRAHSGGAPRPAES